MGRITSFSKQVIVFFLVTALIIRPTFAANVGGWTLGGGVAQGASTVYEGTKKVVIDGVDYIKKGTAKITPPPSGVAKVLARGAAGYALSVAVEQLLGAVDWVLDPANNRIVYQVQYAGPDLALYKSRCLQDVKSYVQKLGVNPYYATQTYRVIYKNNNQNSNIVDCQAILYSGQSHRTIAEYAITGDEETEKSIPLDAVASQVISNAAAGDVSAQQATTAAAADIVAEAKDSAKARPIAQQLEASSSTKPADQAVADKAAEAQGTAKPNEANPQATDLSLEFPAFCGWAPTVCEFAQTAIQSIADAKAEYADKPQENTDTQLDIPDLEDQSIDSDISFGGSCPSPLSSDINFMGLNKTIEFSFDPVCQIAEFIKPVVISISAFSAALIVAGIRTEDD